MTTGGAAGNKPATVRADERRARLRRAVLAGHGGDEATARALVHDPHPEVRAGALGALHRIGVLGAAELITALDDAHPTVRLRACSLAGRVLSAPGAGGPGADGDGSLVDAVAARASSDVDAGVVEMAAWALGEAGPACPPAAVRTLEGLAGGHRDPLCREAAVAALGAVGDPRSLDAVLGALDDRPAVRRRAAVALAGFDDPRAESGLRRCLEDRDWQVREAAEDLLARP